MIIAVDGSAASGKGTLAKRLARHFDLAHLDTGGLYRALALHLMRSGITAETAEEHSAAAPFADIGAHHAKRGLFDPRHRRQPVREPSEREAPSTPFDADVLTSEELVCITEA